MESENELANITMETGTRAALAVIREAGESNSIDYDQLVPILKTELKEGFNEGIADAKDALEANMGGVAESTFLASITIAGARAGRIYLETI